MSPNFVLIHCIYHTKKHCLAVDVKLLAVVAAYPNYLFIINKLYDNIFIYSFMHTNSIKNSSNNTNFMVSLELHPCGIVPIWDLTH